MVLFTYEARVAGFVRILHTGSARSVERCTKRAGRNTQNSSRKWSLKNPLLTPYMHPWVKNKPHLGPSGGSTAVIRNAIPSHVHNFTSSLLSPRLISLINFCRGRWSNHSHIIHPLPYLPYIRSENTFQRPVEKPQPNWAVQLINVQAHGAGVVPDA